MRADPEGARYRDSRVLAGLCLVATHGLRLLEFADAWRFTCQGKRAHAVRAYIPWWLEEKYPAGRRPQVRADLATRSMSSAASTISSGGTGGGPPCLTTR